MAELRFRLTNTWFGGRFSVNQPNERMKNTQDLITKFGCMDFRFVVVLRELDWKLGKRGRKEGFKRKRKASSWICWIFTEKVRGFFQKISKILAESCMTFWCVDDVLEKGISKTKNNLTLLKNITKGALETQEEGGLCLWSKPVEKVGS